MNRIIAWAIGNSPGMNVVMVGLLALGGLAMLGLRRETFPDFELEIVMVSVPYPGATPADVEEGICQKIEESVRALEGIKQVTSIAQESAGFVLIELRSDVRDVQKVLAEIDREVDRISTFPQRAEDPQVQQITFRSAAIREGRRVEAPRFGVDEAVCTGDHACIRLSGCPSLSLKKLDDPLRDDPVASIDTSCVGCGNCGEVAEAAVLCPSFYEARVIHNPSPFERRLNGWRQGLIGWLAKRRQSRRLSFEESAA